MTLAAGQQLAAARADIVLEFDGTARGDRSGPRKARSHRPRQGIGDRGCERTSGFGRNYRPFRPRIEARGFALVPLSAVMPRRQQDLANHQL